MIRPFSLPDAAGITTIYNHYVLHSIVTFEVEPVLPAEMEKQLTKSAKNFPCLVYENKGDILGFAYAGKWKSRCAYRQSVESTIYVRHEHFRRGLGTLLYSALLDELRKTDCHAVIGGISLPNPASVALHEKLGFRKVAHFREVGFKFNQWIDVGYWQLIV